MASSPLTLAAVSLHSSDGIVTFHCSIGDDGTTGICAIIITHSSNNILVLRTTYFPLDDGSGDFIGRNEAFQFTTQLDPEGTLSQSTSSAADNTTSRSPESRIPERPPD